MRNLRPRRCKAERNARSRGLSFPGVRDIRKLTALEDAGTDGDIYSNYSLMARRKKTGKGLMGSKFMALFYPIDDIESVVSRPVLLVATIPSVLHAAAKRSGIR